MSKITVVIDSTVNLPKEYLERYPIRVLPLTLNWGPETFRDGIDIQPNEFYSRLERATTLPTTSQVTPSAFQETFTELLDQGSDILAITISEKLSGTLASALQAQEALHSERIAVVDSKSASLGHGFLALLVARAAESGATLKECQTLAEAAREKLGVFFVVDTLKYLHMGGRIGGAARFLGTALDLKPILALKDGKIEAIERVRTKRKAFDRLLEIARVKIKDNHPLRMGIIHAKAMEDAMDVADRAKELFHPDEMVISDVSPVVGAHAGPGTVGLAFLAGL